MSTFTATLPNGETVTRSSKTMTYRFVIAAEYRTGWAVSWSQTLPAAQKTARTAERFAPISPVAIIPVD